MKAQSPQRRGTTSPLHATPVFSGAWPLAVLLLLAILPYAGILRNDFAYTYDDKALILDSPYVHNVHHLREVLTTTLFSNLGAPGGLPYYRPMAKLGFLLCYQLFGPSAYGFHLVSLLLNVAVVGILFLLSGTTAQGSRCGVCRRRPVRASSRSRGSSGVDFLGNRPGGDSLLPAHLLVLLAERRSGGRQENLGC